MNILIKYQLRRSGVKGRLNFLRWLATKSVVRQTKHYGTNDTDDVQLNVLKLTSNPFTKSTVGESIRDLTKMRSMFCWLSEAM